MGRGRTSNGHLKLVHSNGESSKFENRKPTPEGVDTEFDSQEHFLNLYIDTVRSFARQGSLVVDDDEFEAEICQIIEEMRAYLDSSYPTYWEGGKPLERSALTSEPLFEGSVYDDAWGVIEGFRDQLERFFRLSKICFKENPGLEKAGKPLKSMDELSPEDQLDIAYELLSDTFTVFQAMRSAGYTGPAINVGQSSLVLYQPVDLVEVVVNASITEMALIGSTPDQLTEHGDKISRAILDNPLTEVVIMFEQQRKNALSKGHHPSADEVVTAEPNVPPREKASEIHSIVNGGPKSAVVDITERLPNKTTQTMGRSEIARLIEFPQR